MQPLFDPTTAADHADVEYREAAPAEHQHHYDLYEPIAGMAVVGVSDGEGRVLMLTRGDEAAVLPYAPVEPGDDWVAGARRAVAAATGVDVAVDGVERVRRKQFTPADSDDLTTGYDVVFRATPTTDDPVPTGDGEWDAAWADDLPADAAAGDVLADIRLFLD